ncbi:fungal-specific transcription factor domain-containing protein [Aspergillus spinulosporus]
MGQPGTDETQHPVSQHTPKKRQRFTRSQVACDWCHFNHAKCDQTFPCSRCLDKGTPCEFTRGRRKRGRLPKLGTPGTARIEGIDSPSHTVSSASDMQGAGSVVQSVQTPEDPSPPAPAHNLCHPDPRHAHDVVILSPGYEELSPGTILWPMQEAETKSSVVESLSSTRSAPSPCAGAALTASGSSASVDSMDFAGLADLDAFILADLAAEPPTAPLEPLPSLRYPVLQPLIPFIRAHLSPELACGLLELYFTSAFSTHMHPVCHSIPCYVLRKASFLSKTNYRPSSPALLASMLWVASSDDHALASPLTTHYCRKKTSRILESLTLELLRSSAHTPFNKSGLAAAAETVGSPAGPDAFCDFALYPSTVSGGTQGFECPVGSLDDVITYIHVASVLSLNDRNMLGLRWWQAAFTLARELQLNREMESVPSSDSQGVCFPHGPAPSTPKPLDCVCHRSYGSTVLITEEQREERRRVWWLLYMMDRHLALCHNRPLMLLDSESKGLLLPLDEDAWQAGEIHSNSPDFNGPQCVMSGAGSLRPAFSDFTCHDPSLFGFFLPLMTVLGQLLDIHQAWNHPMLGLDVLGERTWDTQLFEVLGQLDQYEASLHGFAARIGDRRAPTLADDDIAHCLHAQTQFWLAKTAKAYASYYIDLLHILQNGKWDPRSLAADHTLWASTLNLASAVPHALKAAESLGQILHYDPNLSFMPTFFSAQLLQGGFYFLFLLEQLQDQAGEPFLSACEVMLRAAESCTVTLNNGYLKGFCLVMRSTIAQARGRPITQHEVRQRRSAIAALHGWSGG